MTGFIPVHSWILRSHDFFVVIEVVGFLIFGILSYQLGPLLIDIDNEKIKDFIVLAGLTFWVEVSW